MTAPTLAAPLVLFVAFPRMGLLDLTGPQTVFWAAARRLRVATHWGMSDLLAQLFPALDVDRDALFVRQQAIWTSAGVTAGIDLALALVEDEHVQSSH